MTGKIEEKMDSEVGHHSVVTAADVRSQTQILFHLHDRFPEAHFIAEEKRRNPMANLPENILNHIVTEETLLEAMQGLTFFVDPLDGSAEHLKRLPMWSVSIGVMLKGVHVGGAIYAPAVCGGLLVAGEIGKGVFCAEGGRGDILPVPKIEGFAEGERPTIRFNQDMLVLEEFGPFVRALAPISRLPNSAQSTALALLFLATGRIDGFAQPHIWPWDWAAGFPLILELGGKFQFYHYREGKPLPLQKPDLPSYSVEKRGVGFVAGAPEVADRLFELLCQTWPEK